MGVALVFVGVALMLTGLVAAVRGGIPKWWIRTRRTGAWLVAAGALAITVGGIRSAVANPSTSRGMHAFGASDQVWAARHTPDTRFPHGAAYDPVAGLGPDAAHDDRYYDVQHIGGRVLGYEMRLPAGTALAAAEKAIAKELPSDAKVGALNPIPGACAVEVAQSAILAKAAGSGSVRIVLATVRADGTTFGYQTSNVDDILFELGNTTANC